MKEVIHRCRVPVSEVLSSTKDFLSPDHRTPSIIMETIAGRRLFSSSAAAVLSAGRPRSAIVRRGGPDADMLSVLKSAGTLAGTRGWRSAAAELFAVSPLRHIATEDNCIRKPQPLFPGKQSTDIAFVCPTYHDEDRVVDFMKKTFFRHEPTIVATGLSGRVPDSMLQMYRETLREGLSVMAVNADNPIEILGVAINGPVRKGVDSMELRSIQAECEATKKIYDFWAYLAERCEGWPDDVECVMEMKAVATDPKAARSGLAASLTQLSRELAKEKFDYPAFRVDCTSLYSAKMTQKIRIPKVLSFRYKDYLNKDGQPVFRIPAPHTEVCVFLDHFYSP